MTLLNYDTRLDSLRIAALNDREFFGRIVRGNMHNMYQVLLKIRMQVYNKQIMSLSWMYKPLQFSRNSEGNMAVCYHNTPQ